ncbi:NB-ARC domain-containing protein [Streptomyces sp. XD-27]|uniref:NB-ARC domain-containing protein n=1 Tax=Streptomyces sp. XD-27 TaxID=3062779 RepID=UPI0026F470D5|nr:NB-ARC domain-containing protein [Streptomyces sp. XD-27]WKX72208.1 NB-ARC domain-containing protein [Streptomyces sp. XD-27]
MEPFTTSAVLSAIGTVTSGALSGAGGEMGRRGSEALAGMVRRVRRGPTAPDDGASSGADEDQGASSGADEDQQAVLPIAEEEQRELTRWLLDRARNSPGFAGELAAWLREVAWLEPRVPAAVALGASCPQALTPASATFTDREHLMAQIAELLEAGDRPVGVPLVVVLVGPGGIGKTAAAVQCGHLLKERFPHGQLFVDLKGDTPAEALSPSDALVGFLDQLGVPADRIPADQQRQEALFRACVAERRMLVLLDNAHSAAQVGPLLPAASGSLVIVTSRHRLDRLAADPGARIIKVGPLSTADSVRLLTRIAGADRVAGSESEVRAVAERCDGYPLALCAVGSQVAVRRHLMWEAVDRRLAERARRRDQEAEAVDERSPGGAVQLATDATYGELTLPAARLYRMLGVRAWPEITVGMAARAVDVDEDEARALLEELAGVHLLEEVAAERYRFHDLVRGHARQRALAEERPANIARAVGRMATGYLRFAAAADFRVIPSRWRLGPAYRGLVLPEGRARDDGRAALAELRRERENLAAAVRAAEEYGFDDLVWQLCEAMWGLHLRLGFHHQWVETHEAGVRAARSRVADGFGDRRAVARMLVQLAFAYMGLGRSEDAEDALVGAAHEDEAARHHRGQATAVEAMGLLRLRQWRYPEAERCFREAQEILRRIGPGDDGERDVPRALAILEHHIGRALRGRRRYAEAVRQLNGALSAFRALDEPDLYNEGRVYMSLGETHLDAGGDGDVELARVCLDKAIATMGDEGAEVQHADAAEMRARCAGRMGDPAAEAEDLRTAAALYEKAGDEAGAARVRARLAELVEPAEPGQPGEG